MTEINNNIVKSKDPVSDSGSSVVNFDFYTGVLFAFVAAVGWYSHLSNEQLASAFIMGGDPGPAFLPTIALWLTTIGSVSYLLIGCRCIAGLNFTKLMTELAKHRLSALYAASIIILVALVTKIGFTVSSLLFSFFWLFILSMMAGISRRHSLIFSSFVSVLISATLYFVFFWLLNIDIK